MVVRRVGGGIAGLRELCAIDAGEPPKVVIERVVFLHDDDHMLHRTRCGHQLTLEGQALFYLRHAPDCRIREPSRRSVFSGPAASTSGETSDEPRHFGRGDCALAAALALVGLT